MSKADAKIATVFALCLVLMLLCVGIVLVNGDEPALTDRSQRSAVEQPLSEEEMRMAVALALGSEQTDEPSDLLGAARDSTE